MNVLAERKLAAADMSKHHSLAFHTPHAQLLAGWVDSCGHLKLAS